LAKLERGPAQDLIDVREMRQRGLATKEGLKTALAQIGGRLSPYPAIDIP